MDVAKLTTMIEHEVATGKNEIRFGDPTNPRGMMDALVIRLQPTIGGLQYSVRQVSNRGEGSGIYDFSAHGTAENALRIAERYMRPIENPAIRALMASRPRPNLSFYTVPRKE